MHLINCFMKGTSREQTQWARYVQYRGRLRWTRSSLRVHGDCPCNVSPNPDGPRTTLTVRREPPPNVAGFLDLAASSEAMAVKIWNSSPLLNTGKGQGPLYQNSPLHIHSALVNNVVQLTFCAHFSIKLSAPHVELTVFHCFVEERTRSRLHESRQILSYRLLWFWERAPTLFLSHQSIRPSWSLTLPELLLNMADFRVEVHLPQCKW